MADAHARLTGTPGNATAFPMLSGCIEAGYVVSPRFDGNLDFWVNSQHPGIAVAVFGLATQPLYLGSQAPGPFSPVLPCVLIPRPDLIVLLPSLAAETLVVPPVARPLMLYSQSVRLDSGVLATSRAFQIYEY